MFDRTDAYVYAGAITGSGDVVQAATAGAPLILTADSTYGGGTTVNADAILWLGQGGTTGSITGNVVDNGTLVFNRSNDLTFGGAISSVSGGAAAITKLGQGALTLTGTNSYTGPTNIQAGSLFVSGDESAATGTTTVSSGATLGGTGIVGGGAVIADGAALSPGGNSAAPGTLTIDGDLSLSGGSLLQYSFGQAGVRGGPLNDLVEVGGNLTLNGTLTATVSPGGTFDPGLYRVFDYGGTLSGAGLTFSGTPPVGIALQTSVPHEINFVNASGATLNFWDGDAGPKNDNVVNGGNGRWQAFGSAGAFGTDDWTVSSGAFNAPWQGGGFAIFQATPGTVTVDDSLGTVTASGMQFASDGYAVNGGPLTLAGAPATPAIAIIRVGDGTDVGAGFTATISAAIAGDVVLTKTDLGTLVLAGANTYTGGTAINGGTIAIASDSNLGPPTTPLTLDAGALRTTANLSTARPISLNSGGGTFETDAGTQFAVTSPIDGAGALLKHGDGLLALAADETYSGGTVITAGTLQLGTGGTNGSVIGDILDNATLAFDRSDVFTYAGIIAGTGRVEQNGLGRTILTGDNLYAGGTRINAGVLQLGDGGETGSVLGDIENNAALIIDRSDTYDYHGVISGSGALTVAGGGTFRLEQPQMYTGATAVAAGALETGVADAIAPSSALIVAQGGTFFQNGFNQTVRNVANAGTIVLGGGGPERPCASSVPTMEKAARLPSTPFSAAMVRPRTNW